MGLMSAILMIIGTLIGTGIFASPGPLFDSVHCTQTSFMIWAFAGIICTIGAFAYAELGTMFPESGGDFQYLARAYGKKVALVFGWSFITILNPIGTAGIAGVLGRYSVDVITYLKTGTSIGIEGAGLGPMANIGSGGMYDLNNATSVLNGTGYYVPHVHSPYAPGTPAYASFPNEPFSQNRTGAVLPIPGHSDEMPWVIRAFSISAILIMGLINIFFKEGGKYASNVLAVFKIAGMCMLIVIGSIQAVKNHARSEALSIPIGESSQNVLDYVSALCFAFFAYNGFNNINLGLGELRDPERNLKRAVWIAMPFVTVLFLLANFAFFSILSSYDLRHVHSLSLHAGHTVLGQPGGFLMAGTVIASALGSINANIWAGSRLLVIMAKDNAVVPSPIGKVWARTGTQAAAILILIGQASVHALINLDFKTFSKIYSAVGWSWYGLSILGLLYLRKKKPLYPRPVKVFWPLAAMFVMVAFFLVFGSLTLAFMGSRSNSSSTTTTQAQGADGHGQADEHAGAGRYTSVIMFGMAILFMLGVVPAFYLTRYFNKRHSIKHQQGSQSDITTVACPSFHPQSEMRQHLSDPSHSNNISNINNNKHTTKTEDDQWIIRKRGAFESTAGFLQVASHHHPSRQGLEPVSSGSEGDGVGSERLSRRYSTASSVTLVDEKKRKSRRNRERLQRQGLAGPLSHPEMSSPNSNDSDANDHEEEIARAQALQSSRYYHCGDLLDNAEMGHISHTNSNDMAPGSHLCMSSTPETFHGIESISQKLGSRPSETTLGLEDDFLYDKETGSANEEPFNDNNDDDNNSGDAGHPMGELNLHPRSISLEMPMTDDYHSRIILLYDMAYFIAAFVKSRSRKKKPPTLAD
ncbi:hypothetical protein EDD11_010322 [Mortierella claussenii]|nr:hypothetical protein EDD11_010322 [Mortierella claussenii]